MFLNKRAQSTAEYAIALGLVVAVAAGVLQVALKKGIVQKQAQALDILANTGTNSTYTDSLGKAVKFDSTLTSGDLGLYSQDWRQTDVSENTNKSTLYKGGKEERYGKQTSSSSGVSVETLEKVSP